jgi:hypothetical protein
MINAKFDLTSKLWYCHFVRADECLHTHWFFETTLAGPPQESLYYIKDN